MNPKDIVRTGYDKIPHTYRGDVVNLSDPATVAYVQWVTELRSRGRNIARVGDRINDDPALVEALWRSPWDREPTLLAD